MSLMPTKDDEIRVLESITKHDHEMLKIQWEAIKRLQEQNNRLLERNKMLEYSMKAMQNTEKSNIAEICKLQEQNDKLIACLKRAYECIDVNTCPMPYLDNCPHMRDGVDCTICQKKYIAHG